MENKNQEENNEQNKSKRKRRNRIGGIFITIFEGLGDLFEDIFDVLD